MSAATRQLSRGFFEARYFPSLDGLRALSILPVLWHHSTPRVYEGLLGRGPIGVDLFFAISGFLITTLLVREKRSSGRIALGDFYIRRSFRIFPLYYACLGAHCAFAVWGRPEWTPCITFLRRLPAYATYTANWLGPTGESGPILFAFAWSLCTEEQFYTFWAPALAWTRRLYFAAILMAGWFCLDLLLEFDCLGWGRAGHPLLVRMLTSFASPIGLGALWAMAVHERRLGVLWHFFGARYASVLLASVVTSLVVWPWAPTLVLHFFLAAWVVSCAARSDHALAWLLEQRLVRGLGRVSYGVYLWHVPVIGAIRTIFPATRGNAGAVFSVALPAAVVVATISHFWLEQPLLRVGRRLLARPTPRFRYEENTSAERASTVSSSAL